jgi:HTH-type transcriptional regulator/antitoxin MqsA
MVKANELCGICGEGALTLKEDTRDIEYNGAEGSIEYHYSVCSCCGIEQASDADIRFNARTMNAFKAETLGVMSASAIRSLRKSFNVRQAYAGQMFGGGVNAFNKYENNDVVPSKALSKLLQVTRDVPGVAQYLANLEGITLSSKDGDNYQALPLGENYQSYVVEPLHEFLQDQFANQALFSAEIMKGMKSLQTLSRTRPIRNCVNVLDSSNGDMSPLAKVKLQSLLAEGDETYYRELPSSDLPILDPALNGFFNTRENHHGR